MSVHGDEAHRLFYSGYNCAQSVACAFAGDLGLPVETVAQMISGFGAGVGRLREVCGCISGMTFVYGFLRGYGRQKPRPMRRFKRWLTPSVSAAAALCARSCWVWTR